MAKYILGDIFEGNYAVSQYYGNNPSYYSQFGFAGHEGVDWATPTGVKILAPFDYKIVQDIDDLKSGAYGNYIVCWDPIQKCAIWFCHLKENYIKNGQTGKRGDLLALSDNSGNSTGPHLHVNFVETNGNAERLNTNNGYKGMLNILDSNLVEWKMGTQVTPIPGTSNMYKGYDLSNMKSMKVAVDILVRVQAGEFVDKIELDKQKQLTDNLNQQINDRNNDIVQLNTQLSTLKEQVLQLDQRVSSLSEQAKKIPTLEAENEELSTQKKTWSESEKTYNRQISQLRSDLEEAKRDAFTTWTHELLDKIFHRT
jgi:FtsZ-binding cell division protein ZapB